MSQPAESAPNSDTTFHVAIYARFSSEMQNEISIEDQLQRCRAEIARRGWRMAGIYTDSAKSGWSLDRDGFQELRAAAERKKFDAVMFWKFDRLARDHNHIVMIKALLRHQYGLKLFCVEGVSQDDDNSPYTTLVEQMIAVFASFYSLNLSSDTKRAKRGRAARGEYNGSTAPLGYTLVTKAAATPERPPGLYIDPEVAPVIVEAFKRYATGTYSEAMLAEWMNQQPAIQVVRKDKHPIGKEMLRDLLQNRLYTGMISYAETFYDGNSLGQKKKSRRKRVEWFPGKHEAILEEDLFSACIAPREKMATTRKPTSKMRTYILPDRVYCAHCIGRDDINLADKRYGKMRISWHNRCQVAHYRCMSRDRGYGDCKQSYVEEPVVLNRLVEILSNMKIPEEWQQRIDTAVKSREHNQQALEQLQELEEQLKRVQFSWEHGKLSPEQYINRTSQLEREIASIRPLDYDKLEEAADLITHFKSYWDQCSDVANPEEARQQLMAKIIEKVFVFDDTVIAVAMYPDFGVVLDMPEAAPNRVLETLSDNKNGYKLSLYPERERRDDFPRQVFCLVA